MAMPVVYSVVAEYGRTIGPGNTGYWGRAVAACCCCLFAACLAVAVVVSIVEPLQAGVVTFILSSSVL